MAAILSEKIQVLQSVELGRHFQAKADIAAGEMLLQEQATMITPHWDAEQMKCSNCWQQSFVMCRKCHFFPLCIDCEQHDAFDCEFFCTIGKNICQNLLVKNYAIFATLKLLLLLEQQQQQHQQPTDLSLESLLPKCSDLGDYRDSDLWQEHRLSIVEPLLQSGIAACFKRHKLDAIFLHQLCLCIDANAFEVTAPDGDSLKGLYVLGTQLPHHCVSNTVISFDDVFCMHIYAARDIKQGELIYNNYANPLMGTSQRQHQLRLSRHLDCTCSRCLDPTELGTHMSSIKCQKCATGFAVCDLLHDGDWICQQCNAQTPAYEVHAQMANLGEEMLNANGDLYCYEQLLNNYVHYFHPNHFLLLDVKQNIASMLRSMLLNTMQTPSRKLLERKLQLCEQLLPVVRAVTPGLSKLYAIALFEYMMPQLELAAILLQSEQITQDEYLQKLEGIKKNGLEALQMLAFEPAHSQEQRLKRRIQLELQQIDDIFEDVASLNQAVTE